MTVYAFVILIWTFPPGVLSVDLVKTREDCQRVAAGFEAQTGGDLGTRNVSGVCVPLTLPVMPREGEGQ